MSNQCISPSATKRFWSKVDRKSDDECWIWLGRTNPDGYGQFDCNNTAVVAHRLAWELLIGEIPSNLYACHHCDNPRCVNPHHLFLGTQKQNMEDMVRKGRTGDHQGKNNGRSILSQKDANVVREMRAKGMMYKDIARHFNVSVGCVSHIINGRHWV